MPATTYTYSVANDFSNGVDIDKLTIEIQSSAIVISLDSISLSSGTCSVTFKAAISVLDQTLLDSLIAAHDGVPEIEVTTPPSSPEGIPLVSLVPRVGDERVIISHNWSDSSSWYTNSVRVTGEVLNKDTSCKKGFSSNNKWIDMTHGRCSREDEFSASYVPIIYVNGEQKVEREPFEKSGGDFFIDYKNGIVEFAEVLDPQDVITADYSYATDSVFTVAPPPGKILRIEDAEVQFSQDIVMNDAICYEVWVYNPLDLPNKMPLHLVDSSARPVIYKTMRDFVDEARGVYPSVPPIGGPARGITVGHVVLPFFWKTVRDLPSSMGAEIRAYLKKHNEFGGQFATATFYCTLIDE
jgi:hypothetical protein